MDRLINILGAQARGTEAEVAGRSAWIYRTTVAVVSGGTVAALLGAFVLAQFFITRPLRRMAQAMTLMAGGDLAVPVSGIRRGDEIGAMARAVAVFRNNAMALRDAERARAAERKRAEAEKSAALEAVAAAFERDILAIAASIGHAATELEAFAREMTTVLDESHRHAREAAVAARTPPPARPASHPRSKSSPPRSPTSARRWRALPASSRKRRAAPTVPSPIRRRW